MDMSLRNGPRRALVTGAGARLGKAMAEALGRDGWQVAVHYRNSLQGAEATVGAIQAGGGKAAMVQADLSDEGDTATLIDKAQSALGGPLSVLVNSASTFSDDTAHSHSRENWDYHFGPNLRAPILLSQQFAQHLPNSVAGLIVNMIDMRVLKLNPQFFTYTLSKSALWTATRTLAQALATLTQKGSNSGEIVRALRYLIDADSITGQMIASDGGQHLMWQTPDIMV